MTKITFWNLQRLGAGTDPERRQQIRAYIDSLEPDVQLFCELTTASTDPPPVNLTYRKKNARQLCYAARDSDGDIAMSATTPPAAPAYSAAGFKGGNNFAKLADRALASLGVISGVALYLIHAPASNNAQKVMAFIAAAFSQRTDAWMVIGDFNIEPANLLKVVDRGIDVVPLIRHSGYATWARQTAGVVTAKELDYVLASPALKVKVSTDPGFSWFYNDVSDHGWIMAEY